MFSAIAATADGADADMVFPNVEKELPKARATMWRYEPDGNGWAPYGMGTVSADGRQVVPDPGVVITDFASAECEPTKRTHQPPMKRPDLWRQNPMGFGSGQAPVKRRRGGETMSGTDTSGISQQELRSLSLRRTSLHRAGVDSMIGAGLSGKLLRLLLVLMLSIEPGLIELANATTSSTAERKDVPATLQMPAEKIETAKIKIETASLRDAPSDPAPEGSPPLRSAADGITAVAGRVLATDGTALAGVVLRLGSVRAQTDQDGLFVLENVASGEAVLVIDGRQARPRGVSEAADHGIYEARIRAEAGRTIQLPWVSWLPFIDHEHDVALASPAVDDAVARAPAVPGLELRIPKGAVLTDVDGEVVKHVGLTPIPVNRPPFPLPRNVSVPVYFTAQPGGAVISGAKGE